MNDKVIELFYAMFSRLSSRYLLTMRWLDLHGLTEECTQWVKRELKK